MTTEKAGRQDLRILVTDDNAPVREELCELLGLVHGVEVVGRAADSLDAVRLAAELRPDVVLLGLEIRDPDARETARRIREHLPRCRLVGLTLHDLEEERDDILWAEFDVVVAMGAPLESLLAAILGAPAGEGGGVPEGGGAP